MSSPCPSETHDAAAALMAAFSLTRDAATLPACRALVSRALVKRRQQWRSNSDSLARKVLFALRTCVAATRWSIGCRLGCCHASLGLCGGTSIHGAVAQGTRDGAGGSGMAYNIISGYIAACVASIGVWSQPPGAAARSNFERLIRNDLFCFS